MWLISADGGDLTATLEIRKSIRCGCFTSNVEIHWPSWLIISGIKIISLFECTILMWRISVIVWKVVDLDLIRFCDRLENAGQTGMSIATAGYGDDCLCSSESWWLLLRNLEDETAPARLIEPANAPRNNILHLIVFGRGSEVWLRNGERENENERKIWRISCTWN
jgi:hypothetical protein